MTKYEQDDTLLPNGTVDLVAASSWEIPKNDPFGSPITHPRASMLCRKRRTEGSNGCGQSEDVVKVQKPKNEDGDFQHHDLFIHRFDRCEGFLWAKSSNS